MTVITVDRLVKRFGSHTAVDDLSFEVAKGSTFAFLGTNGAGKTTTIGCLTTLKGPTSGDISVLGHKVGRRDKQIRREIGVVFQESLLDDILTVQENLLIRASLYGMSKRDAERRIGELSDVLDVEEFIGRRYGRLSGGQKRRVDIVRALLHSPSILFLDEPTTGLDPDSREKVWDTVMELQRTFGLTIFLTTHYMEETERADQVRIIDRGKIVAAGTPTELRAAHTRDELRVTLTSPARFDEAFAARSRARGADRHLPVEDWREALDVLKHFEQDISDFEFRHGTMDDVFLNITRRNAHS